MALIDTDDSQFVISAVDSELAGLVSIDNALITAGDGLVAVSTGAQWGPVDIVTSTLAVAGAVGPEWEDVVEFSCASGGGIRVSDLENTASLALTDAGGEYRVRVSARGRDAGAERRVQDLVDPDLEQANQDPVEFYLVEAWPEPASAPTVIRSTSRYATTAGHEEDPHAQLASLPTWLAGLHASERLSIDLDQRPAARGLSGRRGTARAQHDFPGTRRKLFDRLLSMGWMTCQGGEWYDQPWDYALDCWQPDQHPEHGFTGRHGEVRWIWQERVPAKQAIFTWNWYLPPRVTKDLENSFSELQRLLDVDSRVEMSFTQRKDADGHTHATVAITHDDLPAEWVEDMTAIWALALETYEKLFYR